MRILSHLCRVLANRVIRSLENPMPLLRSLLFVPGDRPDRMEKALGLGADALILDLEDAVAPDAKPAAREAVAAFLGTPRAITLFVRINPLDSDFIADDLAAMMPAVPDGIVLPKAECSEERRAGQECVSPFRSRWSPYPSKKNTHQPPP